MHLDMYLGDTLLERVPLEKGKINIELITSRLKEKYRQEIREANTAPVFYLGGVSFLKSTPPRLSDQGNEDSSTEM